jgi:hypothetical protein
MSRDGNLRSLFRRNLSDFFWETIECYSSPGVPDSYFCRGGICGWVEFKKCEGNKIRSLTPEQVAWHMAHHRKGGRSFFAVRRERELLLFAGSRGPILAERGLDGPSILGLWNQPWPWDQVANSLISLNNKS